MYLLAGKVKPTAAKSLSAKLDPMDMIEPNIRLTARDVTVHYGAKQALHGISIDIPDRAVTAFIGPSGCGKSTFLRCINRMNDTIEGAKVGGKIELDGQDIYANDLDVVELRARVGMVFQKPNPFPKSIYDNVAYGPRIHGLARNKTDLDEIVTSCGRPAEASPVASSSACALPAPSPSAQKSSSWTSPAPPSTRSPPRSSKS